MATKHVAHYIDDIDGSEAHETIHFSIDGKHYEIDLKNEHAVQLRDALGRFTAVARPVVHRTTGTRTSTRGTAARAAAADKERLAKIRDWARAHGHQVADRGRIPAKIEAEYEAATR
ncbi:MAG: Lsr2 family protein [Promicromonosporaceae bacterium]|nr:Lsr2 family protein [Promicromonosporaceae bacterium]